MTHGPPICIKRRYYAIFIYSWLTAVRASRFKYDRLMVFHVCPERFCHVMGYVHHRSPPDHSALKFFCLALNYHHTALVTGGVTAIVVKRSRGVGFIDPAVGVVTHHGVTCVGADAVCLYQRLVFKPPTFRPFPSAPARPFRLSYRGCLPHSPLILRV